MTPTLKPGQIVLARAIDLENLKRKSVVYYQFLDKLMIKRLIGLPGDEIKIEDDRISINGKIIFKYSSSEKILQFYEQKIPENDVFVIGDNPFNSLDSRKIGTIPIEDLKYRAIARIWPPRLL